MNKNWFAKIKIINCCSIQFKIINFLICLFNYQLIDFNPMINTIDTLKKKNQLKEVSVQRKINTFIKD